MQLSLEPTYVILDFSSMSDKTEIKIISEEIDNLKALKVFVEEQQTVYRWEVGESLVQHCHSGCIVKGSNIVKPHLKLKDCEITVN